MTSSNFDVTNEIVVDVDAPFLVAVHHAFFADLDFLDEPHQRRPVKLFQIVIILHHVQPCVHRLLVLPAGGKLLRQFHMALLLGLALGLIAVQKLDAKVIRDFAQHLVLVGRLHQPV